MSIHGFQLHWQPIANNKLNPILTVTTTNGLTVITFEERIGHAALRTSNFTEAAVVISPGKPPAAVATSDLCSRSSWDNTILFIKLH